MSEPGEPNKSMGGKIKEKHHKNLNNFKKFLDIMKMFLKKILDYLAKIIKGVSNPAMSYSKDPEKTQKKAWYGFIGAFVI